MKAAYLSALILLLSTVTSSAQPPAQAPSSDYDQTPPQITQWMSQPAILVYSKTRAWRHNEGIAGADQFFAELADTNGMGLFTTVNGAVFNHEQLQRFDVVVFNNVTGDTLSDDQEEALQSWIEGGGAFIALHGAGDFSHTAWPWYDQNVIGPEFIGHPANPQFQEARLVALANGHPILRGIPREWMHTDEWYSFDSTERLGDAIALIGIDESSYLPEINQNGEIKDIRMGDTPAQHPLIWIRCINAGRTFYSALGHSHKSYDDPVYRKLLGNALTWVRGAASEQDGCPDVSNQSVHE